MDLLARLDPELGALLAGLAIDELFFVATTRDEIPRMREQQGSSMVPSPPLSDRVERTDHVLPGDPGVTLRVHRPVDRSAPMPAVVSMHGGGYITGDRSADDARHDVLCPELGYVGVAVEYRLAPESPYPGPLEDCYRALLWTVDHAADLGIDPDRVGVSGMSAGGGLAAALALLARDRAEIPIAFQQLIYPMLDDRPTTTNRWDGLGWTAAANALGWSCYLGELEGDDIPAYAAPARATDLTGLPPAFVAVGALDLFCDEDIDYARRLNHAGVEVELHVYPGAPHGFDLMKDFLGVGRHAWDDQVRWLKRRLTP